MKIVGLDIETTGLLESDQRIIEIYAGRWDLTTGLLEAELNLRIDPERAIQAEAYKVHGISGMDLIGKPNWKACAPTIHAFLTDCDLLVGHNGDGFDLPFINMELVRVGLPKLVTPSIDTMSFRWATPSGKPPSLAEVCLACEINYDPAKAHAAEYDVTVMMQTFFNAYRWGWVDLKPSTYCK